MRPAAAACLLISAMAAAADWPRFRGPNGQGVAEDTGLPVKFGPDTNVIWKTPLPPGHSSPVISGSHIFVTAFEGEKLLTIALDRATGRTLWKKEAPRPRQESFQQTHGPASPSPAADGESVFVFFGDFGLLAYSFDGEERWRMPLGPFNNANGHGSSPIVEGGLVLLLCDQDTDSYLLAVDKRTGTVRWKTPRPEVTRGYATPVIFRPAGNAPAEIIVPGSYVVIAYSLDTGEKLWWVGGMAWQLKSVAAIDGNMIYVSGWEAGGDSEFVPKDIPDFREALERQDADKDGRLSPAETTGNLRRLFPQYDLNHNGYMEERDWVFYRNNENSESNLAAIRHGGRGDITRSNVVWRFRKSLPNVPSPLVYQNVLYIVRDGGIVTALDPKTGSVHKQARLQGALDRYWASPVAADGKVFMLSEAGKLTVLRAAPKWDVLAVNDLEDEAFATPAIAGSRLYVRTRSALYCFGLAAR